MQSIFVDTSDSLFRVVVSVPVLYLAVIAFIRISGKRTTSKMNSFDWIVTVAIGSLVSSGVILKDTYMVEVLLAIGLLIALQYVLTAVVARSAKFSVWVKNQPVLLFYDGQMLQESMKKQRIGEAEIRAAIRGSGVSTLDAVAAITLESDATLSVLLREACTDDDDMSAYHDVHGWPREA